MRNPLLFLLVLVVLFSVGSDSNLHAQAANDNPSSAAVVPGDDTRLRRWDARFTQVSIPSSFDSTEQKAYALLATGSMPQPLVVSLHSWSADYQQLDPFAGLTAAAGWNYIHPDFRGPNKTPDACASPAALADIDDAIAYALANGNVDEDRIYVVGGSGGGHACCAISLKSRHRIRAAYAWVPITDLAAWYHQSKDRNNKYATDIESVLESADDFYESAKQRSPIAMPLPLKANKLHLFAGVRDGYEGSVPISHSLLFFNRLCMDKGETDAVIQAEELAALLTRDVREAIAKLGSRDVFFQRTASFGSVTIFDGAHETLHDACFEMLRKDAEVYDVYLLAGQSNMDGRGDASKLTEEQRDAAADAIIYYRNPLRSSEGWEPLATGFSVPPGFNGELPSPKFGPEIGFAAAIKQWNPASKIALIKGSKGGTSLRADWKPGEADQPDTQGPLYRKFIETIQLATADLDRQGHRYVIRGLLWHQGESDSKSSEETYRQQLTELIQRIREDVGVADLPVVVGEVFDNGKRDAVRAAQRRVGTSSPKVSFASARGLTTWDDGTHFDATSQWLLGRRFAAALTKRPMTVVCLGDSITKSGYPALLSEYVDVQAINAGVGGNTSTQGLRRMEKDVFSHDPEVVVLMFGTNDLRLDDQRVHVPVAQFKKNIESMIDGCEKHGAKVVLCTLLPIDAEPFFTRHQRPPFDDAGGLDAVVQQYRTATQEVATNHDVVLLDLHTQLAKHPPSISSDGVHPSEAGKQRIAELVAGAIKSLPAEDASIE